MRHKKQKLNKRLAALMLAVLLCLGLATTAFADGESGVCGDSLNWSLSAGTLTISGSGDMWDFTEPDMAPWYPLRGEILRLVLPEGLTSVGDLAFYGCTKLESVSIPSGVTSIGDYAFAHCEGMLMLNLGGGLVSVGEASFSDCYALQSLRLPESLRSIGLKGFYRCESITSLVIPAGVTDIGYSAFSYCKKLVSADVRANIDVLPEFIFYACKMLSTVTLPDSLSEVSDFSFGQCEQLVSVYYEGQNMTPEQITETLGAAVPGFNATGAVSGGQAGSTQSSASATENADGTVTQETVKVTDGENSSVSTNIDRTFGTDGSTEDSYKAEVNVTVDNDEGWSEAQDAVSESLTDINNIYAGSGQTGNVDVNVYVPGGDSVDQGFVDSMAGRDVTLTVTTQNGSSWVIDCSQIKGDTGDRVYDLSYTIEKGGPELCEELGCSECFVLRFSAPAEVNAEVLIRLGDAWARQNAALFQRDEELLRRQNVVVDGEGCAHFYLASVSDETEYYIAMNLPVPEDNAIIPDALLAEYGADTVRYEPIQYEITGRTSSWGMNIKQVTWIMVAALVVVVLVVGVTMFVLNKRKLKAGYVPDIGDDIY